VECSGCTLCCKLMNVVEKNKPSGVWCDDCICGVGCSSYDTRPKECADFLCMWAQMDKVSEDLRPDKCGVVFEKISDRLIHGTVDQNSNRLSEVAISQVNEFINQGFSVVLRVAGTMQNALILAKGHTKEMIENDLYTFNKGVTNDCS